MPVTIPRFFNAENGDKWVPGSDGDDVYWRVTNLSHTPITVRLTDFQWQDPDGNWRDVDEDTHPFKATYLCAESVAPGSRGTITSQVRDEHKPVARYRYRLQVEGALLPSPECPGELGPLIVFGGECELFIKD